MRREVPPGVMTLKNQTRTTLIDGDLVVYSNLGGEEVAYSIPMATDDFCSRMDLLLFAIYGAGVREGVSEKSAEMGMVLKGLIAAAEKRGG